MKNKVIVELLTQPIRSFEILPKEYRTGNGSDVRKKLLCPTHQKCVAASNNITDYRCVLTNVALLFDYVTKNYISCVANDHSAYVEIHRPDSDISWFYVEKQKEKINMCSPFNDEAGELVALAVLAIVTEENVKNAYEDVMNVAQDSIARIDRVFTFCDSFLYDFAKEFLFYDKQEEMAVEEIKMAYRSKLLNDMTGFFSKDGQAPTCSLLAGIQQRNTTAEIKKETHDMSSFENMEHKVAYEWAPEQLDRIRPVSFMKDFVPTETFFKIMKKMDLRIRDNMVENLQYGVTDPMLIRNDYVNMLFYGDPGTGKTTLANAIAACTGMPIYEVTFNEDSEEDEFEGKNKIVEGKLSFVETAFLEGFANGGILLLEEINLARANIFTSVLNQAMEYPYIIKKNGYERIKRHPLTVIIGTMNLETEGTTSLNSACSQRFTSKYLIEEMSDQEMKKSLAKRGYPKGDINYVYTQYKKLRKSLRESEQERKLLREISIRQCIDALNAIQEGVEPREAVIDSLYGALAVKNKRIADKYNAGMFQAMVNYTKNV